MAEVCYGTSSLNNFAHAMFQTWTRGIRRYKSGSVRYVYTLILGKLCRCVCAVCAVVLTFSGSYLYEIRRACV